MERDTCELPGNGSACRIPVNVDLSELDQVVTMMGNRQIIEDGGFTVGDLAAKMNCARTTATNRLLKLQGEGKVQYIGYRPGSHGEKVWEMVKK